jgi:hypothetical protein
VRQAEDFWRWRDHLKLRLLSPLFLLWPALRQAEDFWRWRGTIEWDLRVAGLREKEQPKGKGWGSKGLVRGRLLLCGLVEAGADDSVGGSGWERGEGNGVGQMEAGSGAAEREKNGR